MKIRNVFAIAGFAFLLMISFTGCDTDPCKDVICENDGTCVDGDCVCQAGYEGTDCSTESRTKFLGSYDVDETCDGNPDNFQCDISKSTTDVIRVIFSNFFNLESLQVSSDVYGEVNGTDITIPTQDVSTITFAGSGSINEATGVVSMTYTASEAGTTFNCSATYTLQ